MVFPCREVEFAGKKTPWRRSGAANGPGAARSRSWGRRLGYAKPARPVPGGGGLNFSPFAAIHLKGARCAAARMGHASIAIASPQSG